MYTCSLTSLPFYNSPDAVVIPVLIRREFADWSDPNANVKPFPVSVRGRFSAENFYINDDSKDRETFMMSMISDVLGRSITWKEFEGLRGSEKIVEYDDREYVLSFFACHEKAYNRILADFKAESSFSRKKLNFNDYVEAFVPYVKDNTKHLAIFTDEPYKTKLGVHRTGYVVTETFNETDLHLLAEVRFINAFISTIGKTWTPFGICAYEHEANKAFNIFKSCIEELS